MNTLIQKLACESATQVVGNEGEIFFTFNEITLQKFAELIVKEAARVAGRDVGHFVLEHFGVEP